MKGRKKKLISYVFLYVDNKEKKKKAMDLSIDLERNEPKTVLTARKEKLELH